MPYPTALSPLFTFFLATSMAIAQTGDWQAVQHLPSGTRLKIKLQRGRTFGHCAFMGATDDVLDCDYPGLTYIQGHYRRDNVKAVYLTHNARAIGLGIGAGSGSGCRSSCVAGCVPRRHLVWVLPLQFRLRPFEQVLGLSEL